MSHIIFVTISIALLSFLVDIIIKNKLSFKYKVASIIGICLISSGFSTLVLV